MTLTISRTAITTMAIATPAMPPLESAALDSALAKSCAIVVVVAWELLTLAAVVVVVGVVGVVVLGEAVVVVAVLLVVLVVRVVVVDEDATAKEAGGVVVIVDIDGSISTNKIMKRSKTKSMSAASATNLYNSCHRRLASCSHRSTNKSGMKA